MNVEDRGSVGTAFAFDGSVRQSLANVPHSKENIHIAFAEVSGLLAPDCPSGSR